MINNHQVVVAPSGTGKSHTAAASNGEVIDGDNISFAVVPQEGYDLGPAPWWQNFESHPDVGRYVTAVQRAFMANLREDTSKRPVLWALVRGGADLATESQFLSSIDAVVIPPASLVAEHTAARDMERRAAGQQNFQPVMTAEEAERSVARYRSLARDRQIPEFASLEGVPAVARALQ